MPCYYPLNGYRSRIVNTSGKRSIVFNVSQGYRDLPVTVPCGQCTGCRMERSRQWAIRCHHEASLHERNAFITLTYSPEHLPKDNSLQVSHFQKFMKRLRFRFSDDKIKYFMCGEYGEKNARPHYHACLFNFDFPDKLLWKQSRGNNLYVSQALEELWPFGYSTIGDVTFESSAYVARYITKKILGRAALTHYNVIDEKGEILSERHPEYTNSSKRPAIGKEWLTRFASDVYPSDFVVVREKKLKPPKYYDKIYDQFYPGAVSELKSKRRALAKNREHNNTPERLLVRETVQLEKLKRLKRSYENDT